MKVGKENKLKKREGGCRSVVHYRNLGCLFVIFKELIKLFSLFLILLNPFNKGEIGGMKVLRTFFNKIEWCGYKQEKTNQQRYFKKGLHVLLPITTFSYKWIF